MPTHIQMYPETGNHPCDTKHTGLSFKKHGKPKQIVETIATNCLYNILRLTMLLRMHTSTIKGLFEVQNEWRSKPKMLLIAIDNNYDLFHCVYCNVLTKEVYGTRQSINVQSVKAHIHFFIKMCAIWAIKLSKSCCEITYQGWFC